MASSDGLQARIVLCPRPGNVLELSPRRTEMRLSEQPAHVVERGVLRRILLGVLELFDRFVWSPHRYENGPEARPGRGGGRAEMS